MAIIKRPTTKPTVEAVRCPVCTLPLMPGVGFGPFCCESCLQTAIRPLILTDPRKPR